MPETYTEWKPYLPTHEAARKFLEASVAEDDGDGRLIRSALRSIAKARKVNMTRVAKDAGITRKALYDALSEDAKPGFATVLRIARALGFDFAVKTRAKETAQV